MAAGEEVGQFPKFYITYNALFHIAVEMYRGIGEDLFSIAPLT